MNDALRELFTTDVGLLSLAALVGIVAVGAFLGAWVRRQVRADEMKQR